MPYLKSDSTIGFVGGSSTSEAAAESMVEHVADARRRVLEAIASSPDGLTDDELEVVLDGRHETVSARRSELSKLGRVVKSGKKRKTRRGRSANVWVVNRNPPATAELRKSKSKIVASGSVGDVSWHEYSDVTVRFTWAHDGVVRTSPAISLHLLTRMGVALDQIVAHHRRLEEA